MWEVAGLLLLCPLRVLLIAELLSIRQEVVLLERVKQGIQLLPRAGEEGLFNCVVLHKRQRPNQNVVGAYALPGD